MTALSIPLFRADGVPEAYEHRPIGRMISAGLRNELKTARHALRPRPPVRFVIVPAAGAHSNWGSGLDAD